MGNRNIDLAGSTVNYILKYICSSCVGRINRNIMYIRPTTVVGPMLGRSGVGKVRCWEGPKYLSFSLILLALSTSSFLLSSFSARAVGMGGLEPVFTTVRLAPNPFLSAGCHSELSG